MIYFTRYTSFIVFLSLLFIGHVALAQERTTIILPTDIQYNDSEMITSLQFKGIPPLPKNCFLNGEDEKMLLHLTVKENNLPDNKTCYIRLENQVNQQIASLQIKKSGLAKSIVSFEIPIEEFEKLKNGTLDLRLKYQPDCFELTTTPLIKFYGIKEINETLTLNNQPKLAIKYELSAKPHRSDWSQPYGDAQQSGSLDWKLDYIPAPLATNIPQGVISGKLNNNYILTDKINIFNHNPITYSSKDDTTKVTYWTTTFQQNTAKLTPLWIQSLKQVAPKFLPLIAENKYLFYFTDGNDSKTQMVILDLNHAGKVVNTISINDIKIGNEPISKIENNITMGYDGSLYLPTNTGVIALTPYPMLKPKWYFNTESSYGPVSLTKDEQLACFIKLKESKAQLIFVDNVTGKTLTQLALNGTYNKEDIPPILIQTLAPTKFNALVLNKNSNADKLIGFEIDYSTGFTASPPKVLIENASLSQPVLTQADNKVYIFNSNEKGIICIDTKNNIHTIKSKKSGANTKTYLGAFTEDVHIVMTNVDNNPARDYFTFDVKNPLTYYIKDAKGRPVFSPDGSVYTINNDNTLNRYYPIISSDNNNQLVLSSINSTTTYGHDKKIHFKPKDNKNPLEVGSTINAQFLSKTFTFQKGFNVKKGAAITFQIIN